MQRYILIQTTSPTRSASWYRSVTVKQKLVAAFRELGMVANSMKAMSKAEFYEARLLSNRRWSLPPWIWCAGGVSAASKVAKRLALQIAF